MTHGEGSWNRVSDGEGAVTQTCFDFDMYTTRGDGIGPIPIFGGQECG